MDEEQFWEKTEALLKKYLEPVLDYIKTHEAIKQADLADLSKKQPRQSSGKKMPEIIGNYTIAAKRCLRCGGKITWDNYDKETHPYPDHISSDGKLVNCPEYDPNY